MNPQVSARKRLFQAHPGFMIALATVALLTWGYAQKLIREHKLQAEFEAQDQRARLGNPVLELPEDLSVGTLTELAAVKPCEASSIDGPEYTSCFGQGTLLGLPGYLTVEWTSQHQLHSLSYDYQLPSAKALISRLVERYGPPHRFDALTDPSLTLGLCWPLPGQGIVVMETSTDDTDHGLSVRIESQVAGNLHELLEAIPKPCHSQPVVSPESFDTEDNRQPSQRAGEST